MTVSRRLSQAISEGDGISVIACVSDAAAAADAEAQGADAIAIRQHVAGVRAATALPVLSLTDAEDADAHVVIVEDHDDEGRLEELVVTVSDRGLELVVDVRDDDEIELALERVDPEIFLLSGRSAGAREGKLERILQLLPDVPAGKLAIADLHDPTRADLLELERAGVDAVLVGSADVAHLVGGDPPEV